MGRNEGREWVRAGAGRHSLEGGEEGKEDERKRW